MCAEEFILEDIKSYPFLGNKANPIPGMDDSAEFQSTVKAMNIMGMTNEDYAGKLTVGRSRFMETGRKGQKAR